MGQDTSDNPLVSVVLPIFNRASLLERAVGSVTAQTFRDWELLICDDGSTDGSLQVGQALALTDVRLRVLASPGTSGAQAARNMGLRAARGDWVGFLDSDDLLLPQSIEARLSAGQRDSADVVYSSCTLRDADGETEWRTPVPVPTYASLLTAPGPMFQSLLVRRAAIEAIGLLDEGLVAYQEWDTAIRLAKRFRFTFVDEPTFVYDRTQPDSISKKPERAAAGYECVVRKHWIPMLGYGGLRTVDGHLAALATLWRQADRSGRARCYRVARWCILPAQPRRVVRRVARALRKADDAGQPPARRDAVNPRAPTRPPGGP